MRLVAIKSFRYAGIHIKAGDIFEAKSNRDVKLLVGINNARYTDDNRPEAKIPKPSNKLVEHANSKLIVQTPQEAVVSKEKPFEPEKNGPPKVEFDEKAKEDLPKQEEPKEPEPKVEKVKEDKPEVAPAAPKAEPTKPNTARRTYNRKR